MVWKRYLRSGGGACGLEAERGLGVVEGGAGSGEGRPACYPPRQKLLTVAGADTRTYKGSVNSKPCVFGFYFAINICGIGQLTKNKENLER